MRDIIDYKTKALEVKLYEEIPEIPHNFAILSYLVMCLSEEASEVGGIVKRLIRDKECNLSEEDKLLLKKELGDVQWMVCAIVDWLGFDMEDVLATNLEKIQDRIIRGTLKGKGDHR